MSGDFTVERRSQFHRRILWVSDVDFDAAHESTLTELSGILNDEIADAILISGDTAKAPQVHSFLKLIASVGSCPVYFVLGNRDYYQGSFAKTARAVQETCQDSKNMHWLTVARKPIALTKDSCVIGHDSFADGRYGDFALSTCRPKDLEMIHDFQNLEPAAIYRKLNALGDKAANHLSRLLPPALKSFEHVVVVTHVPPFKEAAFFEGRPADECWLPFQACKAVGDVLLAAMQQHPEKHMTVLCGHTQMGGRVEILPNLVVLTAESTYQQSAIQAMFEW